MLRFFYNPRYKYTNRTLIDVSNDTSYRDIDYLNIDSPDTINGHIIYRLQSGENIPTYIVDQDSGRRYFVSGITPLSANQKFQISLLRDVLSEGDEWKYEEAYVEAGVATDYNKYKRWNLPFTNTKMKQQRLNFSGKSSFFVFYVNEQSVSSGSISEQDLKLEQTIVPGVNVSNIDITVNNLNEIPSFVYVGAGPVHNWQTRAGQIGLRGMSTGGLDVGIFYNYTGSTMTYSPNQFVDPEDPNFHNNTINVAASYYGLDNNVNSCRTDLMTAISSFDTSYRNTFGSKISDTAVNNLAPYIGKFIYNLSDQKIYKISPNREIIYHDEILSPNTTATLTGALRNIDFYNPNPDANATYEIVGDGYLRFQDMEYVYNYTIEELGFATSFDFTLVANQRKLPKSAVRCVNIVSGASQNIGDNEIAQCLMLAQTAIDLDDPQTGKIIDVQYLPFSIATENDINASIKISNQSQYARFLDEDDYSYIVDLPDLTNMNKETDTINIVSPSRASQYMFNPYNNDGNMEFNVKLTLKPFATSIYVRPSTKGLLINEWDDKDCLIIKEDFSLTTVTSQWVEYVRSNKNFSATFEREIQSKEIARSWERKIEQAQAKFDEYNATNLANQKGRNMTGNIPIISTIAGLFSQGISRASSNGIYSDYMAAAQLDRDYNEAMYQESVSLARDQFNLQMQNLQSQPMVPSKITTIDCKLLDGIYLEFYSTNPTEMKAINDYYFYNGNRIDAYGTFNTYYGWYVKGKIIRSNNYTQPEIDEVNRRLLNGIFTEVQFQ